MRIVSVNVARATVLRYRGRTVRTGIDKRPMDGPVRVHRLNVDGDEQADRRVHGGPFKAVYAYAAEHYAYWRKQLGTDLAYGAFGENITVEGADEGVVRIGDLYRAGSAVLRVTQPRVPCFKLAAHLRQPMSFISRFLRSGRSGFYLQVIEEGEFEAADEMALLTTARSQPTVRDVLEQAIAGRRAARAP